MLKILSLAILLFATTHAHCADVLRAGIIGADTSHVPAFTKPAIQTRKIQAKNWPA